MKNINQTKWGLVFLVIVLLISIVHLVNLAYPIALLFIIGGYVGLGWFVEKRPKTGKDVEENDRVKRVSWIVIFAGVALAIFA